MTMSCSVSATNPVPRWGSASADTRGAQLAFADVQADHRSVPFKNNNEGLTMSDVLNGKPATSFWIIGGAALVWNLIGLLFYYNSVTMTPEALSAFTEAQQEFLGSTPAWATSAYAIAVTAGVLGSLFLLLRRSWAIPLFVLSLLGVLVQDLHAFVLGNALEIWGANALILPAIVIVIAAALIWYSRRAKDKGWLS
jgi:hypothetical protein